MLASSRRDRTSLQRAGRTCLPPLRQVVCVASCATVDGQPSLAAPMGGRRLGWGGLSGMEQEEGNAVRPVPIGHTPTRSRRRRLP